MPMNAVAYKENLPQVLLVGRGIRRLRKGRKLTQKAFSTRAGIQPSHVSRLEKGQYRPSLDMLFRILSEFNVSLGEFLDEVARGEIDPRDLRLLRDGGPLSAEDRRGVGSRIASRVAAPSEGRPARRHGDGGEMAVPADPAAAHARYEELRAGGIEAFNQGRIAEAFQLMEEAWHCARATGDEHLTEVALCNQAAVGIELGYASDFVPRLREALMRNRDDATCRLAAYAIARAYDIEKEYKKALFYARIARDRSRQVGRRDWIASSHNQIGLLLVAESFFDQASKEYEQALGLLDDSPSIARGKLLVNLGYCHIVQQRHRRGLELTYKGLRMLRRLKAHRDEMYAHLDLCFAHLELGRLRLARRHGAAGLELAERFEAHDALKNALYLLGQTASMTGHRAMARRLFARLQRDYYPSSPYIADFLLSVDIRPMVNLRA